MQQYLIISGFNMTGKTVLTDLMKEFEGYHVPKHTFEFNILRIQGGLLDLANALHHDWSPIRSDAAIRRIKNVVKKCGTKASFSDPSSLFIANGMNYNDFFNGRFLDVSNDYINSLIDYEYFLEWPYLSLDEPGRQEFYNRLVRKFFPKKVFVRKVYGAGAKDFYQLTRDYLDNLFSSIASVNTRGFVLHNSVEPYNPVNGLNMFSNAKIIIVQRDPRDVYASNFVRDGAFVPNFEVTRHWELKLGVTGAGNIDTFIQRQRMMYAKVNTDKDDDRVLRLRFEDIVLDYENTLQRIYHFIGEDSSTHKRKGQFFKPELSAKNIGLWKRMDDQSNTDKILKALPEYCYN